MPQGLCNLRIYTDHGLTAYVGAGFGKLTKGAAGALLSNAAEVSGWGPGG